MSDTSHIKRVYEKKYLEIGIDVISYPRNIESMFLLINIFLSSTFMDKFGVTCTERYKSEKNKKVQQERMQHE